MIRYSKAAGVSVREIARVLGASPAAVQRSLAKGKIVDRTRRREQFTALGVSPLQRKQPQSSWSLDTIRAARDAQMRGDFCQAVRLAEVIRTDDALFNAYHARLAPQSAVEAKLVSCGGVRGDNVARRAQTSIHTPRSVMAGIVGTLANHGIAIGYNLHEVSDDASRVDFRHTEWPLEHVKYNHSTEQLETSIKGGHREVIRHGDGRWVVYRKVAALPWIQEACILPASFCWAAHAEGLKDWAGSSASHGLAKIIGELPEGVSLLADESGNFTAEANAFLTMLRDLVSGEAGAGLRPAGSKTDVLSNDSTMWQVFSELILNREKAAARIYTGTDAILGAAGGAPGVDISQLFGVATTRVQGDFEALEQGWRTGVAEPWTAINEGDSRYAPYLKYQLPDPDAKAKSEENAAKRIRLFDVLEKYKAQGMIVDQAVVNNLSAELGVNPPPVLSIGGSQNGPAHVGTDGRSEGGPRA